MPVRFGGRGKAHLCPYPYVRLKVRTNSRVKVPIGQKHWSVRSGRQLRRREARWRATGSERPVHKQNKVELHSAKMHWRARLPSGEAKTGNRPVTGERQFRDLSLARAVSRTIGMHRVVGDRMVRSWSDMNQGSRTGKGNSVQGQYLRARRTVPGR